jgi:hypothetical protein
MGEAKKRAKEIEALKRATKFKMPRQLPSEADRLLGRFKIGMATDFTEDELPATLRKQMLEDRPDFEGDENFDLHGSVQYNGEIIWTRMKIIGDLDHGLAIDKVMKFLTEDFLPEHGNVPAGVMTSFSDEAVHGRLTWYGSKRLASLTLTNDESVLTQFVEFAEKKLREA